jgi:hypothetical protein
MKTEYPLFITAHSEQKLLDHTTGNDIHRYRHLLFTNNQFADNELQYHECNHNRVRRITLLTDKRL